MLKVVLVDDCKDELDALDELTTKYLKAHDMDFSINRFSSPSDFMQSLLFPGKDAKPDLYLFDVMMPEIDGIDLGKEVRRADADARIIYISSSPEFAVKSFEARAFYYILKPVDAEKFNSVMDLALSDMAQASQRTINVKTNDGAYRIAKGDIVYAELKDRRSRYTLVSDTISSICLTSSFLSANEELLSDGRFFACGASLIVNLSYIKSIDRDGRIKFGFGKEKELTLHVPIRTVAAVNSAWMGYCLEV